MAYAQAYTKGATEPSVTAGQPLAFSLRPIAPVRFHLAPCSHTRHRCAGRSPDPIPAPTQANDAWLQALQHAEAARLFIDRAALVQPSFQVTTTNAPALAQICHQLDGLPLALELAAACVKALPVEQIAKRLRDRFRLLRNGPRSAVPRHQTLRATVDWSYDLLTAPERILLHRLALFTEGWTLEAAEAIAYTLSQQSNQLSEQLPIQAYLAALDLAQGNVAAARTAIEPVLTNVASATFATEQRPQELLWIAYQILFVSGDPQAPTILQQAWALVQTQLAQIADPRLRQTFLTNVPVNRELARLVAAGEGKIG